MTLTHEVKQFAKAANEPKTVRNLSKSHKVQAIEKQRKDAEQGMMSFAFKLGRAENQRNERRNKR